MIDWSAAPASSRVGALLVLVAKSAAFGGAMSGLLTLLNAVFLLFTTRINIFPGVVFWAYLAWRLFISISRLHVEGRKSEARGVMVMMAILTPAAVLTALPLNDLLISISLQAALWFNPDAPAGYLVR